MKLTVYERLLDSIVSARTYEISPTDAFILKSPHIRVSCQKQRGARAPRESTRIRTARSRPRQQTLLFPSFSLSSASSTPSSPGSPLVPRLQILESRGIHLRSHSPPTAGYIQRLSPTTTNNQSSEFVRRVIYSFLLPSYPLPSRHLSFCLPTNAPSRFPFLSFHSCNFHEAASRSRDQPIALRNGRMKPKRANDPDGPFETENRGFGIERGRAGMINGKVGRRSTQPVRSFRR